MIAASVAVVFVLGQTNMLDGYSADAQNSSVCESLATQSRSDGDQASQQYEEQECDEIYGEIEYTTQIEENSEIVEGITLNEWHQYVYYDTSDKFSFTIDYEQLHGNEYLYELEPSFESDNKNFVFNDDYEYAVDIFFTHPNEGNPDWSDSNSWLWGDRGQIDCENNVCNYEEEVIFAEKNGNLSNTLMPCQNTDGDVSNFTQKIGIRAYDTNGDRVGWVVVEEHNMGLLDWSGTPCWQEDSFPVFRDGEVVVKSMNISTSMDIDTDYHYDLYLDYGESDKDINSLALTAAFPNGAVDPSSSDYGTQKYAWALDEVDNCEESCTMSFDVNLLEEQQVPGCLSYERESDDIDYSTVEFWVRERVDGGSDYLKLEEPNVTNTYTFGELSGGLQPTQYEPRCWQ